MEGFVFCSCAFYWTSNLPACRANPSKYTRGWVLGCRVVEHGTLSTIPLLIIRRRRSGKHGLDFSMPVTFVLPLFQNGKTGMKSKTFLYGAVTDPCPPQTCYSSVNSISKDLRAHWGSWKQARRKVEWSVTMHWPTVPIFDRLVHCGTEALSGNAALIATFF